jgi:hypothetical protein
MMLELELAPVIGTKSNRLPWCQRASPSTTRYESVKSTDADRLMPMIKSVKWNFATGCHSCKKQNELARENSAGCLILSFSERNNFSGLKAIWRTTRWNHSQK